MQGLGLGIAGLRMHLRPSSGPTSTTTAFCALPPLQETSVYMQDVQSCNATYTGLIGDKQICAGEEREEREESRSGEGGSRGEGGGSEEGE